MNSGTMKTEKRALIATSMMLSELFPRARKVQSRSRSISGAMPTRIHPVYRSSVVGEKKSRQEENDERVNAVVEK